jgi:hypothetical protein
VEQKDAVGNTLRDSRHDRDDTRPGLAACGQFRSRVFLQEHFFGLAVATPPGERAVRNKNSLVEMFLQEHPCRSVILAL